MIDNKFEYSMWFLCGILNGFYVVYKIRLNTYTISALCYRIVVMCCGHNTFMKLCDAYLNVCINNFVELIRLIGYHSSDIGW